MNEEELKKLIWDEKNEKTLEKYIDFIGWGESDHVETISRKEFKIVHSVGNFEGGGEYAEVVFEVDGTFWRVTGFYNSYEGCTWENQANPKQVFPKEKTITVYE